MTSYWMDTHALIASFYFIVGCRQWVGEVPAPSCEKPAIFLVKTWDFAFSTFGIPLEMLATTSYYSKQTPSTVDGYEFVLLLRQCSIIFVGGETHLLPRLNFAAPCIFVGLHVGVAC